MDVRIQRANDEAVVTRRKGTAPGRDLVAAVQRTGYGARVIPVHRFEFDCANVDAERCPAKVRGALRTTPGVRAVTFPSEKHVVVYYDRRRTGPDAIRRIVKRQGIDLTTNG